MFVDPRFDVDSVFGEDSGLEELMDAVDGEEASVVSREMLSDRNLDRVLSHNTLGEDVLGEDPLDDGHAVGADTHLDVDCLTNQLSNLRSSRVNIVKQQMLIIYLRELPSVEVYSSKEEHLTGTVSPAHQPPQPSSSHLLMLGLR